MGTLFVRQYVCGVEVTTEIKVDVSVLKFRVAVNNWRASLALAVDTSARYSRNVQIFMVEAKENWRSGGFPTTFLSNFATIRIQWEYQATSNYTYYELSIPESLSFLGILMCAFRLCLCKLILIFRFLKKKNCWTWRPGPFSFQHFCPEFHVHSLHFTRSFFLLTLPRFSLI